MKALVTGASGFVGYAVMQRLMAAGVEVKVMLRGAVPTQLERLPIEICQGDLNDAASLKQCLQGCDHLFHVAAHYKLWEKDPTIFYRINVDGTRRLITLAAEQSCKIVYTSSVATIKPTGTDQPADETTPTRLDELVGHYKRSKYLAEQAVMELAANGAQVVIVNPSAPIGPFDVKPTPTGKIVLDFLKGKMFGYVHTGLNVVAVEDVAHGHLLALQKGQIGRRYILGNENLYLHDIFRILEKISGIKAPRLKVPHWVAYTAGMVSELGAKLSGKPPEIPLDGVRMARKCMFFDSSRAMNELGYQPTPVTDAFQRAVIWFKEHRYV